MGCSAHFFMTRCIGVVFGTSGRWPTRSGRAGALLETCRGCRERLLKPCVVRANMLTSTLKRLR